MSRPDWVFTSSRLRPANLPHLRFHLQTLRLRVTTTSPQIPATVKLIGASSFYLVASMLSLNVTALLFHTSPNASSTNTTGLSIPSYESKRIQLARAVETQVLANQIANEKHAWRISGVEYSTYDGPVPRPGSLYEKLQTDEALETLQFDKNESAALSALHIRAQLAVQHADGLQHFLRQRCELHDETRERRHQQRELWTSARRSRASTCAPSKSVKTHFQATRSSSSMGTSPRSAVPSERVSRALRRATTCTSDFLDLGKWSNPSKAGIKSVAVHTAALRLGLRRQRAKGLARHKGAALVSVHSFF